MWEIIKAGGYIMWPILVCSVVALAIILERIWTLRRPRVSPDNLVAQVCQWARAGVLDGKRIQTLRVGSPLGRILVAGLMHANRDRQVMKESIEEVGRHVVHDLGRYLNALGTIAVISPLLGLLGTILGMMKIFATVGSGGMGNPAALAAGISEALVTTAAGLVVAILALLFHRYFRGRVDDLVINMEYQALQLVDVLEGSVKDPEARQA